MHFGSKAAKSDFGCSVFAICRHAYTHNLISLSQVYFFVFLGFGHCLRRLAIHEGRFLAPAYTLFLLVGCLFEGLITSISILFELCVLLCLGRLHASKLGVIVAQECQCGKPISEVLLFARNVCVAEFDSTDFAREVLADGWAPE